MSNCCLAVVKAKLGTNPDQAVELFASYRQALADRDQAALRLQKTRVYAPMDGVIGPLDVQPGDYVMAGKALFPLVSTDHYVEAYLKEHPGLYDDLEALGRTLDEGAQDRGEPTTWT